MAIKTVSTTVDEANAGRADLVVRTLSGVSRSQIRGLFDQGCVQINGLPCETLAAEVAPGDIVSLRYDPSQRYREKKRSWDDRTFTIAYEDDHLIVVDKAAGTLSVPTDHMDRNTLIERVGIYLSHSRKRREAHLVHRLDREVSGLLVFGKHEEVAEALIEQFKHRKPQRLYNAIVAGDFTQQTGTFRSHLATGNNLDRYVAPPSEKTELAITHYRVLEPLHYATLVEVQLETGKRNQIRVHFADAGHPVLGDPRYRKKQAQHPLWVRKRIALHATTLGFVHPASGEALTLHSPLPSAMVNFIKAAKHAPRM